MPLDPRSGRRIDSAAQIASKRRRAERYRCPKCGRKSALRWLDDLRLQCYWVARGKCDYEDVQIRS